MNIFERLENWGKWANNATGSGYGGQLATYAAEYRLTGGDIGDALLVDKAVARTQNLNANYPYLLTQYFVNGKSYKTIHADWVGCHKKASCMGWKGDKPPDATKIRQETSIAVAACEGYLHGLQDAA